MLKEQPNATISWSDRRLRSAFLAIIVAAILGTVLLGSVATNCDEYIYSGQARILLHGRLSPLPGDPLPNTRVVPAFEGARYPVGWPLLLAPGAAWSFRAMFLVALALHLAGGAAMARIMVRRGLPAILAAAWLFHPLFWGFSRTLLSDVPAATLLLIAMDSWENRRAKTAGLALGYSFLLRLASVIPAAGFVLAIIHDVRRNRRSVAIVVLGAALGMAALLAANTLKDGHPFLSPYEATNRQLLTASMLGENAWIYGLGLFLIPPFPLACLMLRPRACDRWALVAIPVVFFFLFYGYREVFPSFLENVLGGQRLILAAHASLLVATAGVWSRIPLARSTPVLLAAGLAVVILCHGSTRYVVEHFAPATRAVAACRPKKVAFNINASNVALSTDATTYSIVETREPESIPDVAVVAPRAQSFLVKGPVTFSVPPWLRRTAIRCRRFGDFYIFDLAGRCPPGGDPCDLPEQP